MENLVVIKPWIEELRIELNEALQEFIGKPMSLSQRELMILTIRNILDKYIYEGYIDNNFNVWKYLDFNYKNISE
jgi:hypothetical protein